VAQKLKGIIMVFSFLSVSGKNSGNSGQEFDFKKQLKVRNTFSNGLLGEVVNFLMV
jgi:hypothetical protein